MVPEVTLVVGIMGRNDQNVGWLKGTIKSIDSGTMKSLWSKHTTSRWKEGKLRICGRGGEDGRGERQANYLFIDHSLPVPLLVVVSLTRYTALTVLCRWTGCSSTGIAAIRTVSLSAPLWTPAKAAAPQGTTSATGWSLRCWRSRRPYTGRSNYCWPSDRPVGGQSPDRWSRSIFLRGVPSTHLTKFIEFSEGPTRVEKSGSKGKLRGNLSLLIRSTAG